MGERSEKERGKHWKQEEEDSLSIPLMEKGGRGRILRLSLSLSPRDTIADLGGGGGVCAFTR